LQIGDEAIGRSDHGIRFGCGEGIIRSLVMASLSLSGTHPRMARAAFWGNLTGVPAGGGSQAIAFCKSLTIWAYTFVAESLAVFAYIDLCDDNGYGSEVLTRL